MNKEGWINLLAIVVSVIGTSYCLGNYLYKVTAPTPEWFAISYFMTSTLVCAYILGWSIDMTFNKVK